MNYDTCYHSTMDTDHRQSVLLSTNYSLDVAGLTTTSLCVRDCFEVQFACPYDTTTTTAATKLIRSSAIAQNCSDTTHVKTISPPDNCEFIDFLIYADVWLVGLKVCRIKNYRTFCIEIVDSVCKLLSCY